MDVTETENLRETLMQSDANFRQLANEHKKYEVRLRELSALPFPNDNEQLEEAVLKKKKLALKDQMQDIILNYQKRIATVH